jgi:hypothetical protein
MTIPVARCASHVWHGKGFHSVGVATGFYRALLFGVLFLGITPGGIANPFPNTGPTVAGKVAQLRRGLAYAPEKAPLAVQRAIWAANQLRSKPYRYGGGHASFLDRGYDCSGTISYVLAAAGVLRTPLSSTELTRFGSRGRGKWITIYARNGHAFAVIAGLRLDTTAWNNRGNRHAPRWQTTVRTPSRFEPRHPTGL